MQIPSQSSSRRRIAVRCLAAAVLAGMSAVPLLAKHPTNAGPEDPPIKFPVPTPVPLSPEEELKTFKLPPGFKIELAAAEPLVEDPIAMTFDADGRMWVVEMRGYMHGLDGEGEDQPTCRIKILEDTKGDGHFDKATVWLDNLLMARAVLPMRGGALVAEPPNLTFYKDDHGKAGEKTVVATDYGVKGGQPEHMANGLYPAMDNWIYNAAHPYRYRFQHGKWVADPVPSRGQWGVAQDDFGRMYYCSNSDLGRVDPLPSHYFSSNPYYRATAAANVELIEFKHQVVWPSHKTPGTNRGYADDLRQTGPLAGTLQIPTAACGNTNYRGGLFPSDFEDNFFVCEPAGNLVKRMLIVDEAGKLQGKDAYSQMDFLTSTDERFRPVNLTNGPDGALYVVDICRGVLQHTAFLTNYLLKNIAERHLLDPIHRGRIYRIVPEGKETKPVKLPKDPGALVDSLTSTNGWVRDMAQRLLVEKHDEDTVPLLEKMAAEGPTPVSRLHALWSLDGMGKLDGAVAVKATADPDPHVRANAIRLSEPLLVPTTRAQALPALLKLVSDEDPDVQLQLAVTLAEVPDPAAEDAVVKLLSSKAADPAMMRDAVISGLRGRELDFAEKLLAQPEWESATPDRTTTLLSLAQCIQAEHRSAPVKRLLDLTAAQPEGSWRQIALLKGLLPKTVATKPAPKPATKPATAPSAHPLVASSESTTKPATKPSTPSGPPVKLIYLDAEPASLVTLLDSKNKEVKGIAEQVNKRLAWPGKPGVPPPPKIIVLTTEQQAQYEHGKVVFGQICGACHQPSGLGQEGLAPPLVDSEWVVGPDRRLARIVLQGLNGAVNVDGATYRLEMPQLSKLPDEDIAAVLTFIRHEWEHNATPVKVETVKEIREEYHNRADPWTAKELMEAK
jgi:mono/diheme cytochrome c family protein/glucose/arabinose dehydrogenase